MKNQDEMTAKMANNTYDNSRRDVLLLPLARTSGVPMGFLNYDDGRTIHINVLIMGYKGLNTYVQRRIDNILRGTNADAYSDDIVVASYMKSTNLPGCSRALHSFFKSSLCRDQVQLLKDIRENAGIPSLATTQRLLHTLSLYQERSPNSSRGPFTVTERIGILHPPTLDRITHLGHINKHRHA